MAKVLFEDKPGPALPCNRIQEPSLPSTGRLGERGMPAGDVEIAGNVLKTQSRQWLA